MKVSIAMASYNGAKYIQAQLQSFMEQTHQPDELVVTDDCSTDETERIVLKFAESAPFKVRFHRNERNLGYCGNFNAALNLTSGDLVFISDQDDVWFPDKIKHMLDVAQNNPSALLFMNDAALTDSNLNEVGLTKIGQIHSAGISMDDFVMGCCCCVRRELLDFCLPIPSGFKAHDNWLVSIADGTGSRIVEKVVLQYYRRHEVNESQFIANRVKKVTHRHMFLFSVRRLLSEDSANRSQDEINQLKLLLTGIQTAKKKAPERYRHTLTTFQGRLVDKINIKISRLELWQKWFVPRILTTVRRLMQGKYQTSNGIKSALRDVLGR